MFQYTAKHVMFTGIFFAKDPDGNVGKFCEVFRVTYEWRTVFSSEK